MFKVLWKGRAGQGILTVGNILGECAIEKKMYAKVFPAFGGERLGAPVNVYNYFDDEPVHLHCIVSTGNYVATVDPYFVQTINLTRMVEPGGTLVINTSDKYSDEEIITSLKNNSCPPGVLKCDFDLTY